MWKFWFLPRPIILFKSVPIINHQSDIKVSAGVSGHSFVCPLKVSFYF